MYEKNVKDIIEFVTEKCSKKSLEMHLKKGNPKITDCKLAGIPYIPLNGQYPVDSETGEMLYLLVQINFSDIPHLPDYPTEGILQIFIGGNDLYGCDFDNPQSQKSWRAVFYENVSEPMAEEEVIRLMDSLKHVDGEVMLPFEKPGESYIIEFEEKNMPIPTEDYRFEKTLFDNCSKLMPEECAGASGWLDLPDEMTDLLYESLSGTGSRIGGYPGFTQFDPRNCCEELENYELFIQIDSDGDGRECFIMWGDSGIANFFIDPEDLKRKDFSKLIYNWDCC